ncbi:hypothetical protein L596_011350 [Steinernema carpocapsae]|uniref:Uncharacterized protein n=1 Tax=Steinernema carpocapsae TaxID=34508 RepID=A0A4U5NTL3_STECR|nr:hypothetical protein L596_011350 [Steinernema carpocapsae]
MHMTQNNCPQSCPHFRQPTQTVRVSSLFENMIKSYLARFLGSFLLGSFLSGSFSRDLLSRDLFSRDLFSHNPADRFMSISIHPL